MKDEEKLGQLEEAGAPDRCEPACTAVRRPVKSSISPTSETLSWSSDTHAQQASNAGLGIINGVGVCGLLAPVRWST